MCVVRGRFLILQVKVFEKNFEPFLKVRVFYFFQIALHQSAYQYGKQDANHQVEYG